MPPTPNATVRTFRAPDAAAALRLIKAALGPDAVILATREIPASGAKRAEIEVTAALEPRAEPPAPTPRASEPPRVAPMRTGGAEPRDFGAEPRGFLSEPREAREPAAVPVRYPTPRAEAPRPLAVPRLAEAPRPVPAAEPAPAAVRPAPSAVAPAPVTDELAQLRAALEEMRREMREAHRQARTERQLALDPAAADLYNHLLERGTEEALAEELVRGVLAQGAGARAPALRARAKELLMERLAPARAPWLADQPRVIALVGPTGVGKTTTLAKIAARALIDSRLKVALITVDTYRIGAREQVQRYGEIMGVPTHVATDKLELQRAIARCRNADLVLIDTAGRSVSEAVAKQAELVRSVPGVQLYLVLNAASGAKELAANAERYRALAPERLIFTKLDEASGPGAVLSATSRLRRPIACMTNGQSVPEDLHALSAGAWADVVLGDWDEARAERAAQVAG